MTTPTTRSHTTEHDDYVIVDSAPVAAKLRADVLQLTARVQELTDGKQELERRVEQQRESVRELTDGKQELERLVEQQRKSVRELTIAHADQKRKHREARLLVKELDDELAMQREDVLGHRVRTHSTRGAKVLIGNPRRWRSGPAPSLGQA